MRANILRTHLKFHKRSHKRTCFAVRVLLQTIVRVVDMWSMSGALTGSGDSLLAWLFLVKMISVPDPPSTLPPPAFPGRSLTTTGQIGLSDHHYKTNLARAQSCVAAAFDSSFCLERHLAFVAISSKEHGCSDYLERTGAPARPWILTW